MEKAEFPSIRWNYLVESKASWDFSREVAIRVFSGAELKADVG